ncbi:MAG: dockerin type I domain-containing protein, partial [Candidatus Poribacteria bacterium]|nr:dockerin type I domain-containing protein [Candidatus Poribacteria bacterium]
QMLASGSSDDTIRLWNVEAGTELRKIIGHTDYVQSVAFSPDGQMLASGSGGKWQGDDNTIRLWNVETGTELRKITRHTGSVYSVVFSPDGQMLTSGSSDDTIRLWDVETGAELRKITGHTDSVYSVAFSPDGQMLASGSSDDTIRLWNVETGTELRKITGHTDSVYSVAFSPDGQMLASGSSDDTIRLWNVETGTELRKITGHTDSVYSVAFSPDGKMLASGSLDDTIRLWDLEPPDTHVGITALPVDAPAIGDQLTIKIDITNGENVTGYQAEVLFDSTTLRYAGSANGDFLPDDSFFVDPVVEGGEVILGASSLADSVSGDGTLATLTFEFIAIKKSTLTLGKTVLVDSVGKYLYHLHQNSSIIVGVPRLREDVNLDGVVDILDLTLVAASFGKPAKRRDPTGIYGDVNADGVVDIADLVEINILNLFLYFDEVGWPSGLGPSETKRWGSILYDLQNLTPTYVYDPADVNGDGVIDIVDLVLVAGALGNKAAAPSAWARYANMFRKSDVQQWLAQAQQLNLTDAASQRGIFFLEQLLAALTPKKTALLPNYPNPFNPETWIPYQLANPADVSISIWTVDGKLIRRLDIGHQPVGTYQGKSRAAHWDGKNALGESVASGVYFYTLKAGDFSATRKMLIRK